MYERTHTRVHTHYSHTSQPHTQVQTEVEVTSNTPAVVRRAPHRRSRNSGDERWPIGTTVAVKFGKDIYTGQVTRILASTSEDPKLWHVLYEDEDEEDLDEGEMQKAYNLHVHGDGYVSNTSDEEFNPLEFLY